MIALITGEACLVLLALRPAPAAVRAEGEPMLEPVKFLSRAVGLRLDRGDDELFPEGKARQEVSGKSSTCSHSPQDQSEITEPPNMTTSSIPSQTSSAAAVSKTTDGCRILVASLVANLIANLIANRYRQRHRRRDQDQTSG